MDQLLKQRLVGAVVITALAAIFVPMLFDDPVEDSGMQVSELKIPDSNINDFTSSIKKLPENVDQVMELPAPEPLMTEAEQANKAEESVAINSANVEQQLSRWLIQVGSFSQKENANTLRNQLRKQGFSAFIETDESTGQGTLYKLRIGPELDKKKAEEMKLRLEKKNNIKTILVSE